MIGVENTDIPTIRLCVSHFIHAVYRRMKVIKVNKKVLNRNIFLFIIIVQTKHLFISSIGSMIESISFEELYQTFKLFDYLLQSKSK